MRRRIVCLALVLVFAGGSFHCKKNMASDTWVGTLVVNGGCGHYIVQLLSGPVPDSGVLTKSWTDIATDSTFRNVFGVRNDCTFPAAVINVGDTFRFTLNGPVPRQICNMCDVELFDMPAASNSVTDIEIISGP